VANYKCGKNQTQAKQLVAAKVWLGKLWLETKQALNVSQAEQRVIPLGSLRTAPHAPFLSSLIKLASTLHLTHPVGGLTQASSFFFFSIGIFPSHKSTEMSSFAFPFLSIIIFPLGRFRNIFSR
jgi:hypothetical protein